MPVHLTHLLFVFSDLAYKLADIIGFNFTIKPSWDNDHGKRTSNGSWTGMIGELIDGVCVICLIFHSH